MHICPGDLLQVVSRTTFQMKRHQALESFSRDHNVGLTIARALIQQRPDAVEEFKRLWAQELGDHFDQEETLLGPLLDQVRLECLVAVHSEIRRLRDLLPLSMRELGKLLDAHIRWEERELFPWIEATATTDQLAALNSATDVMEECRWTDNELRRQLVLRRRQKRNSP